MRYASPLVLLALLGLAFPASAEGVALCGASKVSFTGKGPGGFKVVGTSEKLELQDDGERLTLTVPLDSLDTGIELRNRHMREKYLETGKYPQAVLVVPWSALKRAKAGETQEGTATGTLTLHGQTRQLPFKYRVVRTGDTQAVSGKLQLNFRDFGVNVPSYMGITVKPDIDVDVAFEAKES
jgi:polyisoprenoid-binding protein YceI